MGTQPTDLAVISCFFLRDLGISSIFMIVCFTLREHVACVHLLINSGDSVPQDAVDMSLKRAAIKTSPPRTLSTAPVVAEGASSVDSVSF